MPISEILKVDDLMEDLQVCNSRGDVSTIESLVAVALEEAELGESYAWNMKVEGGGEAKAEQS